MLPLKDHRTELLQGIPLEKLSHLSFELGEDGTAYAVLTVDDFLAQLRVHQLNLRSEFLDFGVYLKLVILESRGHTILVSLQV